MQALLLAVLFPVRWLAHELDDHPAPPAQPCALHLPGRPG
jgi:hypothetical protein